MWEQKGSALGHPTAVLSGWGWELGDAKGLRPPFPPCRAAVGSPSERLEWRLLVWHTQAHSENHGGHENYYFQPPLRRFLMFCECFAISASKKIWEKIEKWEKLHLQKSPTTRVPAKTAFALLGATLHLCPCAPAASRVGRILRTPAAAARCC